MATEIKHVQGNVLKLRIPLTVKVENLVDGVVTYREEDFYPDTSRPVTVFFTRSIGSKVAFTPIVNGNVLEITDEGNLKIGTYGVEVICYDNTGAPYRYKVNAAVFVYDATKDAGIVAGIEFDSETQTLDGAVAVRYGDEQVQADWDETDTDSKAYIKHKPDLSVYVEKDGDKVLSDNNYTDAEKDKLGDLPTNTELQQEFGGKQDTINDLSDIRSGAAKGATALQSESDPTVPQWAKQPTKPSYTAQEVGALPSDTHIPTDPVQSDWNEADTTALDYVKNKPDLSHFITKSVDDLVNYYLKSETYTKQEVQALIAAISQFHYEIYASTSDVTTPANNVLYLIGPTGSGSDKYEEYVWPNSTQGFVKIGDTSIDLSGYVTTTALNTALADYTTTADLTTLLAGKQDKIDSSHKLSADLIEDGSTNKAYTATEKTKLNGIEQGAQVNVKPDWNAQSGSAAEILNKPTIPDAQIQSDWNQSDNTKKDYIKNKPTTMGASGSGHKGGLVPDTPSTAGTTKFLREDGTWEVPAGGSAAAYTPTLLSAPTSSTTTYTKDGQTVDFEIGQFCRVAVTGGYDFYQLYDLNNGVASWEKMENDEVPSNIALISPDSGEGIIPTDGIHAETVSAGATISVNPDVVTVVSGAVGTSAITLQVPQDNLAHVWDILMTTDSTVAITLAMSNSETILVPSGFAIGASKNVEISVIGTGTKYYLRYGEFA